MGLWIIIGHALLEMVIIIFLLLGFSFVLQNIIVVRSIGIIGGLILIGFGASIIRDVYRGSVSTSFLDPAQSSEEKSTIPKQNGIGNPVIGGIAGGSGGLPSDLLLSSSLTYLSDSGRNLSLFSWDTKPEI